MKSAETCLLPPCSIGQFVSMFNGVLISLAESRMRIDLLVEETSTRTFTRDHYKENSLQTPELAEALAFRKWT